MPFRAVPYIMFDGNANEALSFYAKALGGAIRGVVTFGDMPYAGMPEEHENRVMHAELAFGDSSLMLSDAPTGQPFPPGHRISITLAVDTMAEAERLYAALSEGAQKIEMPLQQTDWSPAYAYLTDRFGVPWQISTRSENWS